MDHELPEGLLVDTAWFNERGYSRQLANHYVVAGWLEQPARGVYRRPRGTLSWQQAVISLQTQLGTSLVVGGRTALELQGYAHYLPQTLNEIHLYGPKPPPTWLAKLSIAVRFVYHNDGRLFGRAAVGARPTASGSNVGDGKRTVPDRDEADTVAQSWGQWDWPLMLSTPERAVLELLDELPTYESFDDVDKMIEGMANLSPRRLQKLLHACTNVKVKRLFFFFADRHRHAWLKRLKRDQIDLGSGKRMLVKGGKLDPIYKITVPGDFHGLP